mgnify:CR=1 FL=1
MDHLVYPDRSIKELEKIVNGSRSMIIRASAGKKVPYGKVNTGDRLFFVVNGSKGMVRAMADVHSVFQSEKMAEEELKSLIDQNMDRLQLTDKEIETCAGKKYAVLIEMGNVTPIVPFSISDRVHATIGDWVVVEDIDAITE